MHGARATVVKQGTFLYDAHIICDVRIVLAPLRYGTGDYEDSVEVRNDVGSSTFYVEYGSTTDRGTFNSGGGGFASIAEAVASVEATPGIGETVKWENGAHEA
jgi:hypothetical protein